MTVSYVSSGAVAYSAASGTSVTPAFPASIAAGNMLIMIVGQRGSAANVGTVTTPSGWTRVFAFTNTGGENTGGYSTTWGAGTGNTNLYVFKKVATGSETGTETVTLASNNVSWSSIHQYSKTAANWRINSSMGTDVTTGTGVSIAAFYPLGVISGDQLLGAMVIPANVATFSAEAFASSGATIGAATEIHEAASANGNQIGGFVARAACTAGSSAASVRPTLTATAAGTTTNVRGPGVLIRISEFANLTPTTLQGPDAFTGVNGAALPANWTTGTADAGGGGATIQSNRARFLTGSAGAYTQQVSRKYTTQYEDAVFQLKFAFPTGPPEIYPQFTLRASGSAIDGDGGTFLELTPAAASYTISQTGSYANGRDLISAVSLTYVAATDYNLIYGIVGNVLQYKLWKQGDPEPAYTTLDHSLGGGVGYVGVRGGPGNVGAVSVDLDDVALYNYFPVSTTSVSSDLDLRYAVTNSVTSDSDIRWKVANVLTSDSDLRWAVRSVLNSDSDLRYAVRSVLNSDSDIRWKVANVLTSNSDIRWITRNQINSDSDIRWKVANVLTSNSDLRWAVRSSVNSDSDLRWAVRSAVTSDSDIRWRVRVILNSDSDLRYAVRSILNSDSDIRWAVRSITLSAVDLRWITRNVVSSDVDLRWLSYNRLTSDVDLRWAVRSILSSDVDLRWVSRAQATSDVDLRWVTDSSVLSLSVDMDLRWAVRAVTLSAVDLRWITRNVLSSDLNTPFRVRSVALSDADLRWRVRSVLAADLSALWRVRGLTSADLDIRWRGRGLVLSIVDLRWVVYTIAAPATGGVAQSGTPTGPLAQAGSGQAQAAIVGSPVPVSQSFDGTEFRPIVIGG